MPFQKRKAGDAKDFPIAVQLGKRSKRGQVGVEIEVEGKRVFIEKPVPGWTTHNDGSLRGEENCEYVFSQPYTFETAEAKINALYKQFEDQKTQLDDSNRTSVHVHLNVLDFYSNRLTALMALWFLFEDILTQWCGDHRTGNLFCLRAKDAPAIIGDLRDFVKNRRIPQEGNHYAALNGEALRKFGSLEFRTMRGSSDPKPIVQWLSILRRLYDASDNYKDPRTICEHFSMNGPANFFYEMFGTELSQVIRDGVKMNEDEFRESLYEGVRFAQELCYARDWSNFNPVEVKQDVFGRTDVPGDEVPLPRARIEIRNEVFDPLQQVANRAAMHPNFDRWRAEAVPANPWLLVGNEEE